MSRSRPLGFAFGVVAEMFTVVVVIGMLPHLDLGRGGSGSAAGPAASDDPAQRMNETSYYVRSQVERQLDQAGTALFNRVSGQVLEGARQLLAPPNETGSAAGGVQADATQEAEASSSAPGNSSRQFGSAAGDARPWVRY